MLQHFLGSATTPQSRFSRILDKYGAFLVYYAKITGVLRLAVLDYRPCMLRRHSVFPCMISSFSTTPADLPSPKAASTGIETAFLAHSEYEARAGISSQGAFPAQAKRKKYTGLCTGD
jgi:hypothetical protein